MVLFIGPNTQRPHLGAVGSVGGRRAQFGEFNFASRSAMATSEDDGADVLVRTRARTYVEELE